MPEIMEGELVDDCLCAMCKGLCTNAITWYSGGFSWWQQTMHVKYVIQVIYLCQMI